MATADTAVVAGRPVAAAAGGGGGGGGGVAVYRQQQRPQSKTHHHHECCDGGHGASENDGTPSSSADKRAAASWTKHAQYDQGVAEQQQQQQQRGNRTSSTAAPMTTAKERRKRRRILLSLQQRQRRKLGPNECPPPPRSQGTTRTITNDTMIQPTIQGVKEVATRWWQGEHVVIPTECTYEVCSKVDHVTMKKKTATVAKATDVVTPHHHIYIVSSSSTPSALYCPPMVRELCFRPRGYAMKTPTMMSVPSTQMTATASEHRHTTATTSTTTVTKIGAARPGTPRTEKKRQPNKKEDSDDTPTSKRNAVSLVSPQLPQDRKTLTLSSVAAASVMPLPPTIASSSGAAYCRRELKQPQPAQHQVHCFSETYHVLKRLAAAIWPGPHIINVAITSTFSPVAAAEALESTTNKNKSSASPATADAAAAGLTITRPDGTSYLALRCPCHPLSMKVARQFYQQQQLTSTTQDHHNSNDGCAARTISNSNNVMLVGRALAATTFHHEAPSEDDVAQPRVRREFVTEARQAVLGTIPFAYAASNSDTTVSILNGEEQRELFSVPTCEYGQPVPVSLWVDGAKRTVVISRSTTPTTRANAEGTRARGDGATNMKKRTGGCSRITISPTIPLTPENILQAIRQVKASPPASPILAATTPLLARRITSSPSPTSVRSVEGAGATAPSTSNSNSRPTHAATASSSRPVSGTQTTANNDKNDAGKCATLFATACKQQKERLIQAVLCKWRVIVE